MMGLMRRISEYILGVLLVAVSCVNEQNFDVIPSAGDEVKFAAEMGEGVDTKTLYGADVNNPDGIMVKWVDGDKIRIFGTTCAVQEAVYVVSESGDNTPNKDAEGANIADALTKTGEAGVQWGDADESKFIAIYPADKAEFKQNETTISVKSTIPSEQNYVFTSVASENGGRWEGTNFSADRKNPTMGDAIMYAYTSAKKSASEVPLAFNPLTTVLKFRFMGYEYGSDLVKGETIYVQSITITAPEEYAISGDFNIDFSDAGEPSVYKAGNNTNSITLSTMLPDGLYLPIKAGEVVDFNVFTIPLNEQKIGGNVTRENDVEEKDEDGNVIRKKRFSCEYPWTITINTQGHGSFTYTTIPIHADIDKIDEKETLQITAYDIEPGKIHKIKVPEMKVEKTVTWETDKWITQIPPPVYLSELSVPGAWYCTDSNYQGEIGLGTTENGVDKGLKSLYDAGVRAFNIDCRLTYEKCEYPYTDGSGSLRLVCAGSDKTSGADGVSIGHTYNNGDLVKDKLSSLAKLVKVDEYIIVVLTVAEKPMTRSGTLRDDSGDRFHVYGTVDPAQVLPAIANVLNDQKADYYSKLYKEKIHSGTTVGDALGHMIVKVNSNTTSFNSYFDANAMISFASMALPDWSGDNEYGVKNVDILKSGYYSAMNIDDIYWGTEHSEATDLKYYYHQAQRTTKTGNDDLIDGVPSYDDRKAAIDNIIQESESIYRNAKHNVWFQMGIGGTRRSAGDTDAASKRDEVASTLNDYLLTRINAKMAKDPSPVGIVLMNFCKGSYKGPELINAIISMNGKFYLNRELEGVGTNGGTQGDTPAQQLNVNSNAYVGPDAF